MTYIVWFCFITTLHAHFAGNAAKKCYKAVTGAISYKRSKRYIFFTSKMFVSTLKVHISTF